MSASEESSSSSSSSKRRPLVSDISFEECVNSKYVKPKRMRYTQEFMGRTQTRTWDIVESHDAVVIMLFHTEKQAFLMVKQFRPPVYAKSNEEERKNPECGFTYELCAGLVDKNKPLLEIVKEEIAEECGYDVDINTIQFITSCRGNVGVTGNKLYIYFAEIDESLKIGSGGGNEAEGESIEVVFIPADKGEDFILDTNTERPASLAFPFMWFYRNFIKDSKTGKWICSPKPTNSPSAAASS